MPICSDWGSDQCIDGVCEEDSFGSGRDCSKAFDKDEGTFWDSVSGFPHWVGYKFTDAKKIGRARVLQHLEYCVNFKVYGSNTTEHDDDWDLKDWTELYSVSDGEPSVWKDYQWVNTTPYLYVKIHALSGDSAWPDFWAIYELVFYECQDLPAKLSGVIKEKGVGVQRLVRSYIRETGELYKSTTSSADGTFELAAPNTTTEFFLVAFDNDAVDMYNALIFDRVKGVAV